MKGKTEQKHGGTEWNRTMIQFSDEDYDMLWNEHARTRRAIADIVREAVRMYFNQRKSEHRKAA